MAGTQEGQGPDFFVKNVFPPNTPGAVFTNITIIQDTACLKADLSWQTNLECGVDSFFIEYSQNGVNFLRLDSVRANGQGNYSFSPVTANYVPTITGYDHLPLLCLMAPARQKNCSSTAMRWRS